MAEDLPATEGIRTGGNLVVTAALTAEAVESNLGPMGKPDVLEPMRQKLFEKQLKKICFCDSEMIFLQELVSYKFHVATN